MPVVPVARLPVTHQARATALLRCGCVVFLRGRSYIGAAKRDTRPGERLDLERLCVLHHMQNVVAVVSNAEGAYIDFSHWQR